MPEKPSKNVFVTGTDTGVGKTVISTALARQLGYDYWKPVQTGAIDGTDSTFAAQWLGQERIIPEAYVFSEPASPHAAAACVDQSIDMNLIVRQARSLRGPTVIEGAGGVLVPLNERELLVDLIRALQIPVVVVARTSLGTINHTLLTLEALRLRSLPVLGLILVGNSAPSSEAAIAEFGQVAMLSRVAHCESFSCDWFNEVDLGVSATAVQVNGGN